MIAGKPILFKAISASSNFSIITDLGDFIPNFSIQFLNFFLSSAFSIADFVAPINLTFSFFNIPFTSSSIATLRAVWPPIVGSIAHGFSFLIIFSTVSVFIGST